MQTQSTQASLNRVRLLLEAGRSEAARNVLEVIQADTDVQQRDVTYLLGWYYVASHQWQNAIHTLSPFLTNTESADEDAQQETLVEYERTAIHLLRLGQVATNLAHYEDASHHFALCLTLLHDHRSHLPSIRIEARYKLAMTYVLRGSYIVAIQYYHDALRLCHHYKLNAALPTIYYGLSEVYSYQGDFTKAYEAGREALRIYQQQDKEPSLWRMHTMLGRISLLRGDYEDSVNYYTAALSLVVSINSPEKVMLNCTTLADVFLQQGHLDEAKTYAYRAVEASRQGEDAFLCGVVYATIGNVTLAEARQTSDTERLHLFDNAISWLQKAVTHFQSTQAYTDLAQVYLHLATVSEEMSRTKDALSYWKLAYIEAGKEKKYPVRVFDALCYAN